MEQILINLITGALGGVGAGKSSPTFDLGTAGNIISGLVGGGVLGQIITLLLPSVVAAYGADWCNQKQSCCLMVDPISPDPKLFSSSELRVRINDLLGCHRG
jgi:uncharacterized membrane protein YeaQ/YmgE (transglycosylase-associated protein family)